MGSKATLKSQIWTLFKFVLYFSPLGFCKASSRLERQVFANAQYTAGWNWVEENLEGTLSKVWGIENMIFWDNKN